MRLDLDGFAVLRRIGDHPGSFRAIAAEVNKAAHDLLAKQLGAKSTTLSGVRTIRKVFGEDAFVQVVEGLSDAQAKALLARLDKHNAELRTASPSERRERLAELADGSEDPTEKKAPSKKKASAKAAGRKPPVERLQSEAMNAVRKR